MKRLLFLVAVFASLPLAIKAATVPILINGGSFTFSTVQNFQSPFQPTFNLVGANGESVTGTNVTVDQSLTYGLSTISSGAVSETVNPSLSFYTGAAWMDSYGGTTDLNLLVPDPVHIYSIGRPIDWDEVSGGVTANSFTLALDSYPVRAFTIVVPFTAQMKILDYTNPLLVSGPVTLLNEYDLSGVGVARLNFNGGCTSYPNVQNGVCFATFQSATYTFTPEPTTGLTSAIGLMLAGAWFMRRHRR